jgi:hypothetical protein
MSVCLSVVRCRGQPTARELQVERVCFREYKYCTVYRAFGLLGNITEQLLLTGCIQWVQHNDLQTETDKLHISHDMARGAKGEGVTRVDVARPQL